MTTYSQRVSPLNVISVSLLGFTAILMCGCERSEEITTYTVPRHESLQTEEYLARVSSRRPQPARMLAAIVPHDAELWFVKLQGTPNAIGVREVEFYDFVKSLRFSGNSQATWTLPADWKEIPQKKPGRFATIAVDQKPPLEVTVTVLPNTGDDLNQQRLNNINRWRGQLSLPKIEEKDLPQMTKTIEFGDSVATTIDITGQANPGQAMPSGMMSPPMNHPPVSEGSPGASSHVEKSGLNFEKPMDWNEVQPKQFQLARFTVGSGDQTAEVAVSRAGGDRTANINRWRGQIGLEPLSDDELNKDKKTFEVDSKQGEFIELVSGEKTILGVMIPDGTQTWFIKLTGPSELAAKERSKFEAFAKSVQLK